MKTTLNRLSASFSYAFDGLRYAYVTQLNMRVHIVAAFTVALLTLFLPLSVTEILFVTAAVFAVIICELANTAVETVVDMVSPHAHPLAKIAKDIAAAAVMVSAFFAIVVGAVIFLPFLYGIVRDGMMNHIGVTLPSVIAALAMIFLAVSACFRSGVSGYNRSNGTLTENRLELIPMSHTVLDFSALNDEERQLLEQASRVRERAYVPYSRFQVGSAVQSEDGEIYVGCNIENAAYGSTNCAERSALFHAVSRGARPRRFRMMAVIGATEQPITPCGACRQVLAELCPPDMPVILANTQGQAVRTTVASLLPGAFTNEALNNDRAGSDKGE